MALRSSPALHGRLSEQAVSVTLPSPRAFVPAAVCVLLLAVHPVGAAPSSLVLEHGVDRIDAWPAVTVLADAGRGLSVEQVLAHRDDFLTPLTPHANLGIRHDAMWLRVPVVVAGGAPGRWALSVDYASIDTIELFVIGPSKEVRQVSLGRRLPFSQRPWPSSVHAAMLELEPGLAYELLLRIQTTSTMAVPLTLSTPARLHAVEARAQALQGLMAGAALCLLVYSLMQWVGLRDPMFLYYALTLAGTTLFFVAYFGMGPQHLWGDNAWLTTRVAPLSVLFGALVGGFLFVDLALRVREIRPWISRGLRAGAAIAALVGAAFAVDLVDYRVAQASATVLGPIPMLLAIPASWARGRRGERIGLYMLAGWGVYAIGALTMVGLLRGLLPVNGWTQHAFQLGSLFEMLLWMLVLGVRTEDLRTVAQRAQVERDALRSLADTDALTGLRNRRGLHDALARVLPDAGPGRLTAIFLLDLDGFKAVNDRLGHDVGDELLVGVGRRLEGMLRPDDVVVRFGGDEFVVVTPGLPGEDAALALALKLQRGFLEPVVAAHESCRVGLTIGYALAPLDGRDASALLRHADSAMYAGKHSGRSCVRYGAPPVPLAVAG